MIRAVIIDDEISAIEMLRWLIQTYCPSVQIVAECNSGNAGVDAVRNLHPDLLFLDIEMPEMNGFEVLEQIKSPEVQVVFTTAFDQFAVKAFRYAALNYLLKPIDPDDLIETINRFESKRSVISSEQVRVLMEHINPATKAPERIALSSGDGLVFVKTADITYCHADSNYTHVMLSDGRKITVARTLKELDDTLSGGDFARVHNSYLVNMAHIQKYVKGDGGYIVMPDKAQITISRSKREEFFQLFSKF